MKIKNPANTNFDSYIGLKNSVVINKCEDSWLTATLNIEVEVIQ